MAANVSGGVSAIPGPRWLGLEREFRPSASEYNQALEAVRANIGADLILALRHHAEAPNSASSCTEISRVAGWKYSDSNQGTMRLRYGGLGHLIADQLSLVPVLQRFSKRYRLSKIYWTYAIAAASRSEQDLWWRLYPEFIQGFRMAGFLRQTVRRVKAEAAADSRSQEDRPESDPLQATEGGLLHLQIERRARSGGLAMRRTKKDGFKCKVCTVVLTDFYGDIAKDVADAHHILPLAELESARNSRLEDLITVCPNCHRVLHRMDDPANWQGLVEAIRANGNYESMRWPDRAVRGPRAPLSPKPIGRALVSETVDVQRVGGARTRMILGPSMCLSCGHRESKGRYCKAFPHGIPNDIWSGRYDHTKPYPGDNGVQYIELSTGETNEQ